MTDPTDEPDLESEILALASEDRPVTIESLSPELREIVEIAHDLNDVELAELLARARLLLDYGAEPEET